MELVTCLPAPESNVKDDEWSWSTNHTVQQKFSTSYTWNAIRPELPKQYWYQSVWYKGNVPKFSFVFWLAMLNKLPVMERLYDWGVVDSPLCCFCKLQVESRNHILLHCEFSERLWHIVMRRLGEPECIFHNWEALISWLLSDSPQVSLNLKKVTVHATIYCIWRERNARLHNNILLPVSSVFRQIDRSVRNTLLARRSRKAFMGLLQQWFKWE